MSAIKTANLYHSLSLHFNDEKYDALKYNFKIKARKSMSEGHFYIFDKLYKKYKNNIFNLSSCFFDEWMLLSVLS